MTSPKSVPATSATQSNKTDKFVDVATTSLKVGIEIVRLLSGVTKNVPYLGVIAGCIEKLINVREVCFSAVPPAIRFQCPCTVHEKQQRACEGPPGQHLGGFPRARRGSSTHGSAEPEYCSEYFEKRFGEVSDVCDMCQCLPLTAKH